MSRAENWANDAVQLPRLIAEAEGAGAFTPELLVDMATSMDLEVSDVLDLIERAKALWDLIVDVTPEGPFPEIVWPADDERRYIARFVPQAWVRDYAVEIDPEGEQEWDATEAVANLDDEYRAMILAEIEAGNEVLDNDDLLMGDPNSPAWVREHRGPFCIWIREA